MDINLSSKVSYHNSLHYFVKLISIKKKYPQFVFQQKLRVPMNFLVLMFDRDHNTIRYHLQKLKKLGYITIEYKEGFIDIEIKESNMKAHEKKALVRQQCQELFEFLSDIMKKVNLIPAKTCGPELFNMLKHFLREYDMDIIKNTIAFFYTCYPVVFKEFKLSAKIPSFADLYRKRAEIVNFVNQQGFRY